jgi:hypothetical protein
VLFSIAVFSGHIVLEQTSVFSQLNADVEEIVDFSCDFDDNNEENSEDSNEENELEWDDDYIIDPSNQISLYSYVLKSHFHNFWIGKTISISPDIFDSPPEFKG